MVRSGVDCGARPRGIRVPHKLRGGVSSSEGGTRRVTPRPPILQSPLPVHSPRLIMGTGSSPREANTWSLLGNACACPQATPVPNKDRGYLSSASSATPSCQSMNSGACAGRGDVYTDRNRSSGEHTPPTSQPRARTRHSGADGKVCDRDSECPFE